MDNSASSAIQNDEQSIRDLVDRWLRASEKSDLATVLSLMTDDVIFIVPGKEPFGKETFAANSGAMNDVEMTAIADIKEIKVQGDWAWMHNFLKITVTPTGGQPQELSGHVLSILRKNDEGKWQLARDANFVSPEKI